MEIKKKYIIGNWKSNKCEREVEKWFETINDLFIKSNLSEFKSLEIVVCPPLIYLPLTRKLCDNYRLPIQLGAQDVSPFSNGAYTGAVSAAMISDYAKYVIVGHSERRSYFHEDDGILSQKVNKAKEGGLEVIYCVPSENTAIPAEVGIVAYEPIWAIGTGKAETPENAERIGSIIKQKYSVSTVIYGGSVGPENVNNFLRMKNIDGVLPGGASLDPQKFWEIIVNASTI